MTPTLPISEACEPRAARELMAEVAGRAIESTLPKLAGGPRALRVEIPLRALDALQWLRAQSSPIKTYWYDREDRFEMAGVGAAEILESADARDGAGFLEALEAKTAGAHPNLRYYGGVRFDVSRAPAPEWASFGAFRMVLPRIEVFQQGSRAVLACNVILDNESEARAELDSINAALSHLCFSVDSLGDTPPRAVSREDRPSREEWNAQIGASLGAFARRALDKIVLARMARFTMARPIEPLALLGRLIERTRRKAFYFCFQLDEDTAFLGASPEMLYRRRQRFIQSEAIAGTRPRGATETADAVLAEELLRSEKDRREHQYVVSAIRDAFNRFCHAVHGETGVSVLQIDRCQHLYWRLEGILREDVTDAHVLAALHPTPAVGGQPTRSAVARIAEWEPFDRGWYAGPVGWVSGEAAELAVAIRSGLVCGDTVSLYAGAGIVDGSQPDEEWDEIENKMASFASALSGDD